MQRKKIFAVHLLNDYSGSPLVFRQSLDSLKHSYDIHLFTATPSGSGFLSNIENIQSSEIKYNWSPNKIVTLFLFIFSQWQLFWQMRKSITSNDIVYINTLLPFGAAMAGISKKCKVVYHVHEVSIKPKVFKSFLVSVAEHTASKVVFVSDYVASCFRFKNPDTTVIHNALPVEFTERAREINGLNTDAPFNVLMLCSLKAYKGVYEFMELAKALPNVKFQLVLNTTESEAEAFKNEVGNLPNCCIFSAQSKTIPFYKKAHLVLNLSRTDEWVETFGMTVLEAMYCGRPVIVPPVGGVCELVNDGVEGFQINSRDTNALVNCINNIISDFGLYKFLSNNALRKANFFTVEVFDKKLKAAFVSIK